MLNWIIWNGTVFVRWTEFFEIELFLTLKMNLRLTELFETELFWHLTVCKQKRAILILNWILWIWSVWLNWIAWNRNVFDN